MAGLIKRAKKGLGKRKGERERDPYTLTADPYGPMASSSFFAYFISVIMKLTTILEN